MQVESTTERDIIAQGYSPEHAARMVAWWSNGHANGHTATLPDMPIATRPIPAVRTPRAAAAEPAINGTKRGTKAAAKRGRGKAKPRRRSGTGSPPEIRRWAAEHGIECNAHGRIPVAVLEQYSAALDQYKAAG